MSSMRCCFCLEAHNSFACKCTQTVVYRVVVGVDGRERVRTNCVTHEIVFQPLHPDADAPLHESIQSLQEMVKIALKIENTVLPGSLLCHEGQ